MKRKIILPKVLSDRLDELAKLENETNGVLFYRNRGNQENECPCEGIYITNVGTEGHVQAPADKINLINQFLQRNPEYRFIKFHTHTIGTIRRYGQHYATNFSEGDIAGIKAQLKAEREFIALLITPERKLISGIDNPELVVAERVLEYEMNHQRIHEQLQGIGRELRIPQEGLQNRRKLR